MIIQWFASPEWAVFVKALMHTLWQAALVAVFLALALQRSARPAARYRLSMGALALVMVLGLGTWAILNGAGNRNGTSPSPAGESSFSMSMDVGKSDNALPAGPSANASPSRQRWTAWLALAWFAGAGLMLVRAGAQVAGAEKLRRSCRPLEHPAIAEIASEAKRALGLARQVKIAVTDKLTSPAVAGVLVPTLIIRP